MLIAYAFMHSRAALVGSAACKFIDSIKFVVRSVVGGNRRGGGGGGGGAPTLECNRGQRPHLCVHPIL